MATKTAKTAVERGILTGKTAVITGANRGVGKAIAEAFARAGACAICVVRDRGQGEPIVSQLKADGWKSDIGVADISNPAQIAVLALDLAQRHPAIDIVVNNAGIFLDEDRRMRPSHFDPLVLERTLAVNLYGAIEMCDAFIPHMPDGGRIINVSSTMGQLSGDSDGSGPAYSISKVALNMYTQCLAADLRPRRIMVDSFHPGWVKTAMGGPNANVEPEEAAQTALFLATRPPSTETGLFWRGKEIIEW
ncbi:MAG: short-chain dehydrogenase [Candidatus Eremiobacter antarcticus]|nr:SDR family NAD(P)-dependent oxidoreductase [Candidatus Eremiobacteraeota bacterium]MBC5807595.1 SDR family NAD(P)-dependent oxidoreductase [Candidatus Eremiobacteraeota bacterium]PZR61353.1 MAG: short-chain dehydrogenase [Candidatus Eremiobacter sp. RRmetagenome_bin22]